MVRSAFSGMYITQLLFGILLDDFLQFGLVVLGAVGLAELRIPQDLPEHKTARLIQSAV